MGGDSREDREVEVGEEVVSAGNCTGSIDSLVLYNIVVEIHDITSPPFAISAPVLIIRDDEDEHRRKEGFYTSTIGVRTSIYR